MGIAVRNPVLVDRRAKPAQPDRQPQDRDAGRADGERSDRLRPDPDERVFPVLRGRRRHP